MAGDGRDIDGIADKRFQQWIRSRLFDCVELAIFQILDTRCKAITQEMAEAKDMIRSAGGVGLVFGNS